MVTFFNLLTLEAQGQWDSITALGALFPRFLFRPLEESFAIHFRDSTKGLLQMILSEIFNELVNLKNGDVII